MKNASPKVAAASAAFSKNGIMLFKRLIGVDGGRRIWLPRCEDS